MKPPLAAVLLDVGGTLWPDRGPAADVAYRQARLHAAAARMAAGVADLFDALRSAAAEEEGRGTAQDRDGLIRAVLARMGLDAGAATVGAVRTAMYIPAAGRVSLFDGAHELLTTIRALGMRCVVVSNSLWRDAEAYRRDFEALGVAALIDAVVTSIDAGFRKPHRAIFDAALAAAGCTAERCVMIGNSEEKDVLPALTLRMRAIRIAIEELPPIASAADAVATSLPSVTSILRGWAADRSGIPAG